MVISSIKKKYPVLLKIIRIIVAVRPENEKREIKFTPDYEAGKPIFLGLFKELANDNNGLVHYDKLQERLISTGKFDAGGAILMIERMEKISEIDQTEQYHVYRIRTAASHQ